jgi:hypothetical protein
VRKAGARVEAIRHDGGDEFAAAVFIDASYEGDLMARAGVKYTVGREGRDAYGESIAGVQARSPAHQWPVPVPALDEGGRPLPGVQPGPPGEPGAGDRKVQAYNFRLCMTDRKDNLAPFPKPADYDPRRYELLARYLARKPDLRVGQLMNPVRMPNGKTDTNNNGAFSTDHIGANWDYPDADEATRERSGTTTSPTSRASSTSWPTTPACPSPCTARCRAGAWPRTSSPTPGTGRTSSTSARPGGCAAPTS